MRFNFSPSNQKFLSKVMSNFSLLFNIVFSTSFIGFSSCENHYSDTSNNDSTVGCDILIMVDSSRGDCS